MTLFEQWAAKHPHAAADLAAVFQGTEGTVSGGPARGGESAVQQQVRVAIAKQGALAWRNNVGATPARCKCCGEPQTPVRYGLANDSAKLNKEIKSSDLILAIPRVITQQDVGRTIAQFGSIETKRPGWKYTGANQETGQLAWITLINRIGGFAAFSTGDVEL